ncbi:MAG: CPBP family intramembrane metalloprotease [Prevotellaceae bacterium]|nr:CPBP family intramembrane metalloprotease [Prevotellaceae bacterium]
MEMPNDNQHNNPSDNFDNPFLKPYPTLSQSWTLFGFFLLFSFGIGIFLSLFSLTLAYQNSLLKSWITLFSYIATFALLFFFIKQQLKIRRQVIKLDFDNPDATVLWFLLFITLLSAIVIEPLSAWIPVPEWFSNIIGNMVSLNFASFLTVVIAAPLCEESLCRGIILKGLLKNNMKPEYAIMCSALIFAALHLNPWQGIPAFLLGCLMGWAYYKSKSLWVPVFIHFVNNGFAFLLLAVTNNPDLTTRDLTGGSSYIAVYLASVVLLITLLYGLSKYFENGKRHV